MNQYRMADIIYAPIDEEYDFAINPYLHEADKKGLVPPIADAAQFGFETYVDDFLSFLERAKQEPSKYGNLSSILESATPQRRKAIVLQDILKIQIEGGSPDFEAYLISLKEGQSLLNRHERGDILLEHEKTQLNYYLDQIHSLYTLSLLYDRHPPDQEYPIDIDEKIAYLRTNLQVPQNQPILDRLVRMYFQPMGYHNINDIILGLRFKRREATYRHKALASKLPVSLESLPNSGVVKAVRLHALFLSQRDGFLSKEYWGRGEASVDKTPFDTDVSKVAEGEALADVFSDKFINAWGEILCVIEDRGQLQGTNGYELLYSGVFNQPRHYAIRTGFPVSEIDYVLTTAKVNEQQIAALKFLFANTAYIPIIDHNGKLIFSPDDIEANRINTEAIQDSLGRDIPDILSALQLNPFLHNLYQVDVGGGESMTLQEHTQRVMQQFMRNFYERFESNLLSKEEFMLLLALHDIGKGFAMQARLGRTAQHTYNAILIPIILRQCNITEEHIRIMSAIGAQDYLGNYLNSNEKMAETDQEEAEIIANVIIKKAKDLGVSPEEFLHLLTMYYVSDASSYTKAAGSAGLLDHVFAFKQDDNGKAIPGSAHFVHKVQTKYDLLVNTLRMKLEN